MECRKYCGACCIALSINHALPNMPNGKPAGIVCANLDKQTFQCALWGTPDYPNTCKKFLASDENCGKDRVEALQILQQLEIDTTPDMTK